MNKSELESLLARIDVWLLVFGIVVVIGVAGESFFGIRHWWNSRKLKTLQDNENANQAAEISRLNSVTAEALRQAADANRLAEQERLARTKLEERFAWRRITPKEHSTIVAALTPHAGTPVEVITFGELEAATYGEDVVKTLHDSGWAISRTYIGQASSAIYGLQVFTDQNLPAGKALAEVFKAFPGVQIRPLPSNARITKVVVGLRPPP